MSTALKIALGDLRHNTIGRHSVCMPLGPSLLVSYLLKNVDRDDVDIHIYVDPYEILSDVKTWIPDVVGLSHYMWNSSLSRLVFGEIKKDYPHVACIGGGPNFPSDFRTRRQWMLEEVWMDFYIPYEAEIGFTNLIQGLLDGVPIKKLMSNPPNGVVSINDFSQLISGGDIERVDDLDDIPSPYLSGVMDKWFEDGHYAPFIETTRGCPFSCAFCHAGNDYYKKISRFSGDRMKEELDYIVKHMENYPHSILYMADNNFGMYERDEKLAKYMRELQDRYNWPLAFDHTTGKANYDRILRIASILQNKMSITCSCQTLNPKTLDVIGRKNLPMNEYKQVQSEIKSRGMPSVVELIVPLPEETKQSFFDGVKQLMDVDVGIILVHTTILLENTRLNSDEMREKYDMKTAFRLVPRQFGEYNGERCFEVEEVCISTNTMSFEDYLEIRGFFLILSLLSSSQYNVIERHLGELDIDLYDYCCLVWEKVCNGDSKLSHIYNEYINETKKELWDSPSNLRKYFSEEENYQKLLSGDLGDNLIRKYTTEIVVNHHVESVNLFYEVLYGCVDKKVDILSSLYSAKNWLLHVGNISSSINVKERNKSEWMSLAHDVPSWYRDTHMSKPLSCYDGKFYYNLYYDSEKIDYILQEGKNLFGDDINYGIGKILINVRPQAFWRKTTKVE